MSFFGGDNKVGWIHYNGANGVGSLLSMWHKEAFSYDSHLMGRGFIAVFGQHLTTDNKCVVVNLYATCNLSEKVALWEELSTIKSTHQDLVWCFFLVILMLLEV